MTRFASLRSLPSLAALALAAASAGCSLFPKHEEVWTPIPTRLGERRIAGTDTAWVLAEPAYEVVTRDRERLPDLKSDLDLAARTYHRYFGADPRPVALVLADSLAHLSKLDTMSIHLRGLPVVPVIAPRPRGDDPPGGGASLAVPAVVRAWVRARAGADTRLPPWLLDGAAVLVGEPGFERYGIETLRRHKKLVRPLAELFTTPAPAVLDSAFAPGRPVGGREGARHRPSQAQRDSAFAFHAQSAAVAQFFVDRSGAAVIGRLIDAARTASDPAALLAAAGVDPATPQALEQPWRDWLQQKDRELGFRPETYSR